MEEPAISPPTRSAGGSGSFLDSPEIRTILKAAFKNWWIFIVLGIMGYGIGYFWAYRQPDIYGAQTQLLFKANTDITPGSIIAPNYGVFGSYQGVVDNYNEMQIIQSYDLLKQVVEKLHINISYFIEGRLRKTEWAVPFKVNVYYLNSNYYESDIHLNIIDKNHYRVSYQKGDNTFSQIGSFGDDFITPEMKLRIMATIQFDASAFSGNNLTNYIFQIHNINNLVNHFRSSLTVKNPDYTNIIQISLHDWVASRAISFLDTLDELYMENTVLTQFKINENTLLYIDKEMKEVTDILDTIENELELYKAHKNILVDVQTDGQKFFDEYDAKSVDKNKLLEQIQALNDLEQYIIEGKDPEFLPPSVYIDNTDQFLMELAQKLYTDQLQIIAALGGSTEQNPSVVDAKKNIKDITTQLLTYISNSRKALNDQMAGVDSMLNDAITNIRALPDKQRGFENIKRREDVNTKLYEFLLEKRADNIIEKAAIIPETRVIETARSLGVVEPDRKRIYYLFMTVGLIVATLIMLIRQLFFDRIESGAELKSKTSFPVLGEILSAPTISDLSFSIEDNPKSPLTESFRTLRTNLQYMITEPGQKVLLFTSNGPSEGKTFCSMNISAMLAKADKKVLLLEFDLHKPRMHKVLNASQDKGLSTILIRKTTIEETILHSPIDGLDMILCGPVPPNSSELVLSERVKEIINYGRENYDYVIIDTPPLGFISDALILMKLSDVNLFVMNTRFAYKEALKYVQEVITINKIKNFGFVLNNVKRKRTKYYYRRYGYYGGYGYGYGGGYGGYGGYGG